ncbi:hypothetical protein KCU62_g483, partial [Aureobasidium sp. EXF-3399]
MTRYNLIDIDAHILRWRRVCTVLTFLKDRGFTVVLRGAINVESARNLAHNLQDFAAHRMASKCSMPNASSLPLGHAPEASNCVLQVIARALISLEAQSSVENIASDSNTSFPLPRKDLLYSSGSSE